MKLFFVLCLAVGAMAANLPAQLQELTGIKAKFSDMVRLEAGLGQQMNPEVMRVVQEIQNFMEQNGITEDDITCIGEGALVGTADYPPWFPRHVVILLKQMEKAGIPKYLIDELARAIAGTGLGNPAISALVEKHFSELSTDWVKCLENFVSALLKCGKNPTCIIGAITNLLTCLSSKDLIVLPQEMLN